MFKQLNQSLVRLVGDDDGPRLATEMITPLGGVHMREAIDAMADVASGRLARDVFVRDYGFRGNNEFELSARPWGDDPATLDRLIDAAGRSTTPGSADAKESARNRVRELAGWRWPLLRAHLALTEKHLRWRENGKVPMAMGVASIRLVVLEAARRLVDRGRIGQLDDVFYLRKAELAQGLSGAGPDDVDVRIARRRATRQLALEFPVPEIVDATPAGICEVSERRWKSLGLIPPETADAETSVLVGVAGSAGSVTGRARIVTDPTDVEIDEGDISGGPRHRLRLDTAVPPSRRRRRRHRRRDVARVHRRAGGGHPVCHRRQDRYFPHRRRPVDFGGRRRRNGHVALTTRCDL